MLSAALYVILGVILTAAVILILPIHQKYFSMQNKVSRLEREYRELKAEYQNMLKEVYELEHQAFAIEKIGREKFNLCRENEQILIYK